VGTDRAEAQVGAVEGQLEEDVAPARVGVVGSLADAAVLQDGLEAALELIFRAEGGFGEVFEEDLVSDFAELDRQPVVEQVVDLLVVDLVREQSQVDRLQSARGSW